MARPGAGRMGPPRLPSPCVTVLLLALLGPAAGAELRCASRCTCTGQLLDCSQLGLTEVPRDLPTWPVYVNLSYNKLTEIDPSAFAELPNLREVRLNNNELTAIPALKSPPHIVSLYLARSKGHWRPQETGAASAPGRRDRLLQYLRALTIPTCSSAGRDRILMKAMCFYCQPTKDVSHRARPVTQTADMECDFE